RAMVFWIVGLVIVIITAMLLILTKQQAEPPQLSPERIAQLRLEYPAYNTFPELILINPSTFLEIAEKAESVIIGQVIKQLPQYEVNLISDRLSFVQYEVAVEKVISGEPTADTIYLVH